MSNGKAGSYRRTTSSRPPSGSWSPESGEADQWKRYDGEFHQALISNCGSRQLMEAHALVFDKYFRYLMVAFKYRHEEPAAQHKALLDCALARDAATAKTILAAHVNNCVEHALTTTSLR